MSPERNIKTPRQRPPHETSADSDPISRRRIGLSHLLGVAARLVVGDPDYAKKNNIKDRVTLFDRYVQELRARYMKGSF